VRAQDCLANIVGDTGCHFIQIECSGAAVMVFNRSCGAKTAAILLLVVVLVFTQCERKYAKLWPRQAFGNYPLAVEEARNIRTLLIPSGAYSAIELATAPLCEITKDGGAHLAAIELDTDRAAATAQKGITTVHGSAFECRVPAETCSLLYLNPPYDSELGPHSHQRMEFVFLEHCFRSSPKACWCSCLPAPSPHLRRLVLVLPASCQPSWLVEG
jgi:hypothetical protein